MDGETEQLVRQVRDGRGEAFERLFDRHRRYLMRVVELRFDDRLRSRVDPADIVQEAYMEAHRRFGNYVQQPPLPFRLWLRQIACDHAQKARRRHIETAQRSLRREISLPEGSSLLLARQLHAGVSTPSQNLERKEMARRVREAIERLPDHEQEVVVMRHFEGLSNQEIGLLLEAEPATVSKRHGRALLRLHAMLFEPDGSETR